MTGGGPGETSNGVWGDAGPVVQAQSVRDVHFHSPAASGPRLHRRPVADWHPYTLQVHQALPPADDAESLPLLPGYLRRPHDDLLDAELRDLTRSKLIVLVGGSSTGKTRALYEAISRHEALRQWGVIHPRTGDDLYQLMQSDTIEPYNILWLNELHHYFSGPHGQTVAAELHARITSESAVRPILAVATLWPEFWAALSSEPVSLNDPHPCVRSLLGGAVRITVAERFSADSVGALLTAPSTDPRLREAARTAAPQGAVIQTLVGGPSLVRRFETPDTIVDRYATAVVSVALDARQLGHRDPFPHGLLAAAASAYLAEEDRVGAAPDWFEQGLRRATRDRTHGISLLLPARLSDNQPGAADSYDVHDYLEQHGRRSRRYRKIPPVLWKSLLDHTRSPADRAAIGLSAYERLVYTYAEAFLRSSIKEGYRQAKRCLADLLHAQHRFEEEVHTLAMLSRADFAAHQRLIDLLVEHRAIDDLKILTDRGDSYAIAKLADVYVDLGRADELAQMFERTGEGLVRLKLAQLLERQDRIDEAIDVLTPGDEAAHLLMVAIMARHDRVGALEAFHHDDTNCLLGDLCARHAQSQLVDLLAKRGEPDRARSLATRGPVPDQRHQALLLWKYDYTDAAEAVLQPLSDAGDVRSARYRTDLRPRPAARASADGSDLRYDPPSTQYRLANYLASHEMIEQLRELADSGYDYGRWRLLNLLAERGDPRGLAELADKGDVTASRRLAEILARQGRVAELSGRALRGDVASRNELVWLATATSRSGATEAANLVRHGLKPDGTSASRLW
ncbi:hypothetical protein AB0A74_15485 [Saccharothrix sp. NPDC042600]|uniref:tetratricopeptide repeat protein n=1 Tax=Saccharothrix TaxID=2071 RepID=UPI0033E2A998|nr:hypothetical protein GCM10017745_52210 [Saccharothrix mutabilis subsp. capreolus]